MKFLIFFLFSSIAFALTDTKEFDAKGITSLKVENSSGVIKIIGSDGPKATAKADMIEWGEKCRFMTEQSGGQLLVKVYKRGPIGSCDANLTIHIPKNASIDASMGSGEINIAETTGKIKYELGKGSVNINAKVPAFTGKSGMGSFNIKGLTGSATLETGTGDIKLSYSEVPKSGFLDITTGKGDAEVMLPSDSKILTRVTTGIGKTYNELGDNKDAKFKVTFESGYGNLFIKKIQ